MLRRKILGDLGADVVKVEPPGGDPLRRQGPWLGGAAHAERGLIWLARNASKRGIALDLEAEPDRAVLRALARNADVWLESDAPGAMAARGLGAEALCAANPRLIHCAVTPFGSAGPQASWRAHDLVLVGPAATRISPVRPIARRSAAASRPPTSTAPPRRRSRSRSRCASAT